MMIREIKLKKRIYRDEEWVALMNTIKQAKEKNPGVNYKLDRSDYGQHLRRFVDLFNAVVDEQEKQDQLNEKSRKIMGWNDAKEII